MVLGLGRISLALGSSLGRMRLAGSPRPGACRWPLSARPCRRLERVEAFFNRDDAVVERIDRAQPVRGPAKAVLYTVEHPDSHSAREVYERSERVLTRVSEPRNDVAFLRLFPSSHAGTIAGPTSPLWREASSTCRNDQDPPRRSPWGDPRNSARALTD